MPVQVSSGSGMPDVVAINNQPCTIQSAALPPPAPPRASHAEAASSLTTLNGQIIGLDGQPLTLWGINWFGFEDGTTMLDGLWAGEAAILTATGHSMPARGPYQTEEIRSTSIHCCPVIPLMPLLHQCYACAVHHHACTGIQQTYSCLNCSQPKSSWKCGFCEYVGYPFFSSDSEHVHVIGSDSQTLDFATIVYRLQLLGFNAVRLPFSFSDLYDKQPASQQRNCPQACLFLPTKFYPVV